MLLYLNNTCEFHVSELVNIQECFQEQICLIRKFSQTYNFENISESEKLNPCTVLHLNISQTMKL